MELKEIIKVLIKRKVTLILYTVIGGILGISYYLSPPMNHAIGSFYIERNIQVSEDGSFSYEGYYSQQVAISYTNTAIALIESPDIRRELLVTEGKLVNEKSLRILKKNIDAKKTGPQLIQVKVSDKDSNIAQERWITLAEKIQQNSLETGLSIKPISKIPVIITSYRDIVLFSLSGMSMGLFIGSAFGIFLEYLKENDNA